MNSAVKKYAGMNQAARGYGLLTLVALVVTGMIGSGVFTTSGFALESLGSRQAVLAAWVVGGLIAVAGAVAYGGLASRLPQSGGEYLYLSRLLHPFAGFLAGMVSLTAGFSGGIAFAALTCQEYATAIMPLPSWLPDQTVATVVVLLACLIHVEAGRLAAGLNTVIVLVKVLLIAGLILWGYRTLGWSGPSDGQPLGLKPTGLSLGSFAMTVVWIMFSYTGFNEAVYVAAEARAPDVLCPWPCCWARSSRRCSIWPSTIFFCGRHQLTSWQGSPKWPLLPPVSWVGRSWNGGCGWQSSSRRCRLLQE